MVYFFPLMCNQIDPTLSKVLGLRQKKSAENVCDQLVPKLPGITKPKLPTRSLTLGLVA